MLIGVVAYFLFACAVLALAFLPPARAWALRRAQRWLSGGRDAAFNVSQASRRVAVRAGGSVGEVGGRAGGWVTARWRWITLAAVALTVPPLIALALRGGQELGTFDHTASRQSNAQVTALLDGERLVPPPALPPELFTTPEVEEARPLIRYASREWQLLDEEFRRRLLVVFKLMQEQHGYELVLLEGYRTPERQAQLAALGSHVTRAGAYESYHQFGLAADLAFRRDGKVVIRETDPWAMHGYDLVGELSRSVGLVWGGGWSLKDYGHVELRRNGVLRPGGNGPATAQAQ